MTAVQRISRRVFAAGGVALGCSFARAGTAPAAGAVRFGLTPVFLTSDLELLRDLQAYLAFAWGRDVELVSRRTYQENSALLLSRQVDAAWICGYPYVQYRDQLDLLAVPVWQGMALYRSYIIVHAGRSAATFDDLAGDVHAFSDPDSNSG